MSQTGERWSEAVRLRLEYLLGALWLILTPTVLLEGDSPEVSDAAREFRRERGARRYNDQWDRTLLAWGQIIRGGSEENGLRAFGIADGVDAVFGLASPWAYSWREGL